MKTGNGMVLAGSALAAASVLGLILASPAPAKDRKQDTKVERVIILTDKHQEKGEAQRMVRVLDLNGSKLNCDGDKTEVNQSTGNDRERTRVVICGNRINAAERAERLEQVLARINASDELSAEHKQKVTQAIQEAIARLRAGQ